MKKKRIGIYKEFKEFINKGNIIDLAIGIIIGNAFSMIVNSLVNDMIMPLISNLIKVDISSAKLVLREEIIDETTNEVIKAAIYLNYGNFIQTILNFLIIALSIFFAIRTVNRIKKAYVTQQIKYVKKLKKKYPELFDDENETGTLLYEKLKREHPEFFQTEEAKKTEEQIKEEKKEDTKDPLTVNNELLEKLNKNIELLVNKTNIE